MAAIGSGTTRNCFIEKSAQLHKTNCMFYTKMVLVRSSRLAEWAKKRGPEGHCAAQDSGKRIPTPK